MDLKQQLTITEKTFQTFSDILPSKVCRNDISKTSKSALKAYLIRAGLLHRTADLSRAVIDLYKQNNYLPAIVLTRSLLETFALFHYFIKKLDGAVDSGRIGEFDDTLMRLFLGARDAEDDIKPVNVLTVIDKLNRNVEGFREMYDAFCEVAHPNWMGAVGYYGRTEESNYCVYFDSSGEGYPIEVALSFVSSVMEDSVQMDESLQSLLTEFTSLHEQTHSGDQQE